MDSGNWIKQLLTVGVSTTSLVAEKMQEVSERWVREGRIDPEQARALVDDLMQRLQADSGDYEQEFERQMERMLQDLGVARQGELDELRGRIDRLERQIRDWENKRWR